MKIMIKPGRGETFRRTVRDADGNALRVLEFFQGRPTDIDDQQDLAAIREDLGVSLVVAKEVQVPRWKADDEATNRAAAGESV